MSASSKKRLFIALNLPQASKDIIAEKIKKLNSLYQNIKWVKQPGLHITLHFLGEIEAERVKNVNLSLQSFIGKFCIIMLEAKKINAFPNLAAPRVIFLKCDQANGNSIFTLHKLIGQALAKQNFPLDKRAWQPHITLGRAKSKVDNFAGDSLELPAVLEFTVESFDLMESELTPLGANYKTIASYELSK